MLEINPKQPKLLKHRCNHEWCPLHKGKGYFVIKSNGKKKSQRSEFYIMDDDGS